MATGDYSALYRQMVDAVNEARLSDLARLCAGNFADHRPLPGQSGDLDGLRHGYAILRSAFPDFQIAVEDTLCEGDKLVVRSTWHGTHHGAFFGIPPTNARFNVSAIEIVRIADGRLAERWAEVDLLGILQQLGVLPPAAQQGSSTRID